MKKSLLILVIVFVSIFLLGLISILCFKPKTQPTLMENILKRDKIIVGVKYDSKPFGFKDKNGVLLGFDVDLAKKIAQNILGDENKVEFVEVTPSSRILTLTSGSVDMIIATMSITPHRQNVVNFSIPYYVAGEALMTPVGSDIGGLTDLRDKRVIVVLGTTAEKNIKQLVPSSIIKGYKTDYEAFEALKSGRGDALVNDDTILAGLISNDSNFKILSKRYTQEPYAIAFRQDEESDSLRININHILEHMQKSGELNRLKNKWIDF